MLSTGAKVPMKCNMGTYEVDTQARMGKVDGRYPHWVSPHTGERYSLIYYQTAGEWEAQAESVFAEEQPIDEQRLRVPRRVILD